MNWDSTRCWVCGMLFAASAIAYIDRQTLAVVAPLIATQYDLKNEQMGRILSAFLMAYTFGQLLAGRFFDWVGSRLGFALSISVWSLANALTAAAGGFWGLVGCRFALGVGESGNFPGGIKVVSEHFPPQERSFATGLFTSGASVGALLAGPLVSSLAHYWGWRAAFLLTGGLGLLWLAVWWSFYQAPPDHPGPAPGDDAAADTDARFDPCGPAAPGCPEPAGGGWPPFTEARSEVRWVDLLCWRPVWAIALARFFEEAAFWVYLFWLPKYVVEVKGFSVLGTGWLLVPSYIALDVGYLSGGWLSRRLMQRGWPVRRSKLAVMAAAALLMTCSVPAAYAASVTLFMALISLCLVGHGAWFTNVMAMPADIAPRRLVASLYGITALGGGLGGVISTETTGIIADRYSFTPVFLVTGILPIVATTVLVVLGGPGGRTRTAPDSQGALRDPGL